MRFLTSIPVLLSAAALSACFGGGAKVTSLASARAISDDTELIGGPNATARPGDFLLQNDRIRVIVRRSGVEGAGLLIDADHNRFPGEEGHDRLGRVTPVFNGTRTVANTRVFVLEDGSATGTAIVRAEGDDIALAGVTPVQEAAARGDASSQERDATVGMLVKTDYILRPGAHYVEIRTTFLNRASAAKNISYGDVVDYGSTAPFLSGATGFALPVSDVQISTAVFESDTVSYGYHLGSRQYINQIDERYENNPIGKALVMPLSTGLGLFAGYADRDAFLNPGTDKSDEKLEIPGGGSAAFSRYIIVGEGDAGRILEGMAAIDGNTTSEIAGQVTTTVESADGSRLAAGLAGADLAVFSDGRPFAHVRTDADGRFSAQLPKGKYQLAVNAQGYPYATPGSPAFTAIEVEEGVDLAIDGLTLPSGGSLRVFLRDLSPIRDQDGNLPAVVTPVDSERPGIVTFTRAESDPSPAQWVADGVTMLPFRPATAELNLATVGPDGSVTLALEPGSYEVRAYAGPFFSTARLNVDVQERTRIDRVLELAQVVQPGEQIVAEFNAATWQGNGSASPEQVILDALANGVDLVVAADAGIRTELSEALADLDAEYGTGEVPTPVSSKVAVAPGERVLTAGFGSFAAWPVVDPSRPWDVTPSSADNAPLAPAAIIDSLVNSLTGAGKAAMESESLRTEALVQIDRPYGAPSSDGSVLQAYFEAADPVVDWGEGTIASGSRAVDPAQAGLAAESNLWVGDENTSFTGLNVLYHPDRSVFELGLNAWFALLNIGYNNPDAARGELPDLVAMASGAANGFENLPAARPRNYVGTQISKTDFKSSEAQTRYQAIGKVNEALAPVETKKASRNVISNAPTLTISVAPKGLSAQAVGIGEVLRLPSGNEVDVTVRVESPCWAPVDRLEIFANTAVTAPTVTGGIPTATLGPVTSVTLAPAVYDGRTGLVDASGNSCRSDGTGFGRLVAEVTETIALSADAWLVPVVTGTAFQPDMAGQRPTAVANPVYVDADGDSAFDTPCPGPACPNTGTTRLGWR